jgi:hypothetical protein
MKSKWVKRLSFEHLLDEEMEKTPFLALLGERPGAADGVDA